MSIPARVAQYRVIRLLGEGGMGAVYEAIDDAVERRVAIKVLQPQYAANQNVVARFFNEARAVNRIDHPSTVKIFESSNLPDGTAYLVMELLKGESLASRLRQEKLLPVTVIADIGWQIATALEAAHGCNIVHRDLKPDNLMLVADPVAPRGERVKVLDFGIAKLVEGVPHPTKSNVIMGTPTYMSPEQCKGAGSVDGRSDVYSLGVILFEMLAGRPPFIGEGPGEVIGMHLFAEPPDLATVAPQTPPGFTQLVNRLLLKDRAKRPTLRETINTLAGLRDNRAAAPTVVQVPVMIPVRRSRPRWAALSAIVAVLALASGYVLSRLDRDRHAAMVSKPAAAPDLAAAPSSATAQQRTEAVPPSTVAPPPPVPELPPAVLPPLPASAIAAPAPAVINPTGPKPTSAAALGKPQEPSQAAGQAIGSRGSPPAPKSADTQAAAITSVRTPSASPAVRLSPPASRSQGGQAPSSHEDWTYLTNPEPSISLRGRTALEPPPRMPASPVPLPVKPPNLNEQFDFVRKALPQPRSTK